MKAFPSALIISTFATVFKSAKCKKLSQFNEHIQLNKGIPEEDSVDQ